MSIHFVNMTVTTATYRRQLPKAYENMFLNLSLRLLTINIYLTYLKKFWVNLSRNRYKRRFVRRSKKFSKIWVYLARLSSFPETTENTVPFATGNFRKLKLEFWSNRSSRDKPKFLKIQLRGIAISFDSRNFRNFRPNGSHFRNPTVFGFSRNFPRNFPYHLPSFRKFRNFWLNGKRPLSVFLISCDIESLNWYRISDLGTVNN